MTPRKTQIRKAIGLIMDAERSAHMKNSNFDYHPSEPNEIDFGDSSPTEFIRSKTELWRESWIIEPLRDAIKILNNELFR